MSQIPIGAAGGDEEELTILLNEPKRTIASRLNISAETLSRALGELQDAGVLMVDGREIQIRDLARLQENPSDDPACTVAARLGKRWRNVP